MLNGNESTEILSTGFRESSTQFVDLALKDKLHRLKPYDDPRYNSMDDMGNGRLFADVFKDVARYNTTSKQWYVYDGKIWKEDVGGMEVSKLAKRLSIALYLYAGEIDCAETYRRYAAKLGSRHTREIMLKDAEDINYITNEMLDTDTDLFNCQNCIIDLCTFEAFAHDPKYLLSKVSSVVYDRNAVSEDFDRFINEVMQNDAEKIEYLQKAFGYALTGDTALEEMYILYGATTRNGKSTLIETISFMMGGPEGYSMTMSPESLAQKPKDSRQASGDIARLNGCRFLNASEPPKRMIFNTELLKILLGRDKITARHLYQREEEFYPIFKLFMNTNYLPVINDDTVFSSGRIKVITFDRHFSEKEQDRDLKERLRSCSNVSGIFNWCLDGLRKYRRYGMRPPDAVKNATEEYRQKSDKVGNFFMECMVSSDKSTPAKEVYQAYAKWCSDNGYGTENKGNFFADLRSKSLLTETATVAGRTLHNVVVNFEIDSDMADTHPFL